MRSFLSGSLERISSGNLAESSYSFCFTMNYRKFTEADQPGLLLSLPSKPTQERKSLKVSTFLSPLWIDGREKLRMLEPWVMDSDWLDLLPGKSALMLARGRRSPQGWSTPWRRRLIKIPASPAMTFVPQYQDLMKFPEGLWMTSFSRTWAFLLVLLWRSLSWLLLKLLRLILYTHIYFRPWAMKKKWHFSFLYNFTNIQSIWTCDTTIRRRISRAFHWWYWICHLINYWQRYLHSKSNYQIPSPPLYNYSYEIWSKQEF